ncbi:pyruvate kinase [Adhaeretor mobilis]|uniref:Pyruvate kinase n=1 Tax=Adhaeretor mobilis TaxID=1930276 RepID=A0A517N032_9BACT|nr:pyruvate kinase [Adhaeretor mobilis]QDT00499.1 Pyruvate kinase [Adhaeretor mobilis]
MTITSTQTHPLTPSSPIQDCCHATDATLNHLDQLTTPANQDETPRSALHDLKMPMMNSYSQWARTKIIATVGPACCEKAQLAELIESGADVFRLNMAHAGPDQQQVYVDRIREVSQELNQPIGILVDLAGPKFRLGDIEGESIYCDRDAEFALVASDPQGPYELTTSYDPLIGELSKGDFVMLADGTVGMSVVDLAPGRATLRVVQPGLIRSRQGINLPGVKLSAPAISVDDHTNAIWAGKAGVDFVSLSFVRSPDEVRNLRDILRSAGSKAMVIAKIEKREALDRLDDIVKESDGIMVARGDLGVEIDVAQMPLEQKRIIRSCQDFHRPVIIATQMLDSMHDSARPTRAEATDVANAILDGADACMLSGETAIGNFPNEAVSMMNRIAMATEASMEGKTLRDAGGKRDDGLHKITQGVVRGAGTMAQVLGAKLVVVSSHSGRTAMALSQQRSFVPTIGVSTNESTLCKMCLYWGVTPLRGAPACVIEDLIRYTDHWACETGLAKPGDAIVIVGGTHLTAGPDASDAMASGAHDIVIVHEVEGPGE